MTNTIRLMAWNVEGRLTRTLQDEQRSTPEQIMATILDQQPDIAFFAESTREEDLPNALRLQFEAQGYTVVDCPYDDPARLAEDPTAATHSICISRLPVESVEMQRYGGVRQLPVLRAWHDDALVTVAGIHLDDRSEEARLVQADGIEATLQDVSPRIFLGDFNAIDYGMKAMLVHSRPLRWLARMVPHAFLRSALLRAYDMTSGHTLSALQCTLDMYDADKKRRSTATPKLRGVEWMPAIALLQLDHILLSRQFTVQNFAVLPDGGSDHRAIVCDIALDKSV